MRIITGFSPRTQADSSGRDRCPPHSGSDQRGRIFRHSFRGGRRTNVGFVCRYRSDGAGGDQPRRQIGNLCGKWPASLEALRANIAACGFTEQCKVFAMDALRFLKIGGGEYDVAFIDPPYNQGLAQAALPLVAQQMAPGGSDPVRD